MNFSHASSLNEAALLSELQTTRQGLSTREATLRQAKEGRNELVQTDTKWRQILARQFRSPFIYLLLGAAALSFFLHEWIDGYMVLLFISINVILGFAQEYHSEKTFRLLKKFVQTSCHVRRDQQWLLLPSADLVPGDIVRVEPGDIVAADMRLLEEQNLTIDESTFTGESLAVKKMIPSPITPATEPYQATNCLFSGSTVVSGEGMGIVCATGGKTSIGALTKLTTETAHSGTFEKGISQFSGVILRLVCGTLVIFLALHLALKPGASSVFELLLFAVALAVSVIPEALPVVMTMCLSKGARHLAQHHVIVKRLSAIEDLGSIEVLCTDKTGTLTQNSLTVMDLYTPDKMRCLQVASLASAVIGDTARQPNNSFDIAIWRALNDPDRARARAATRCAEIPFDPVRRKNSVLVTSEGNTELIARGAPEDILPHTALTADEMVKIEAWLKAQGLLGRRVLAISSRSHVPCSHYAPADEEQGQIFLGIVAFEDAIKPTAAQAVKDAERIGVSVTILTGDHPDVARAVANQIGLLKKNERVLTGADWEALSHEDRVKCVKTCHVFARVSPEQKYTIIKVLEEKYTVGFLGEGINDAPALKMAHVGIVVKEASDVAREAADVVLLENSLDIIIQGIQEGRAVFANSVKYIRMTLAANFGNFYAIAAASFLIDVLPLLPIQILLVNLLSDFPMIAIATDHVDPQELQRPHSYNVRETIIFATLLGIVSTVFDFIFFAVFRHRDPDILRTQWFMGSILTELAFIYSARTKLLFFKAKLPSFALISLTVIATLVTVLLPFTRVGMTFFSFSRPLLSDLLISLGIVIAFFTISELTKLQYVKYQQHQQQVS